MLTDQDNKRIKKIGEICEAIKKLTDADFAAVDKMIVEQTTYCHPLKSGSAGRIVDMGLQNRRILNALKETQKEVLALAPIMKRKIVKF